MPSITKAACRQKAVLWANTNTYDDDGQPQVSAATELKVRWETERMETPVTVNESVAYDEAVQVRQEVAVGSIMWKGKLKDLPSTPNNLRKVVDYIEIPGIKGRIEDRWVLLVKYSDILPTVS